MALILKLFIAHLLGDFILQTDKIVADKNRKKAKSVWLYFHAISHGLLSMILVAEWTFLPFAVGIIIIHLLIDLGKLYFNKDRYKREAFFIDQLLHLITIAVVAQLYKPVPINLSELMRDEMIALYASVLFLTKPVSVIIKIFISKWTPVNTEKNSLQSAGNWIGIIERLLIFGFIMIGKWEAVGFLLAAKSIFRFGDLRGSNDRKLTEYVLIGTLTSFSIAILIGMLMHLFAMV